MPSVSKKQYKFFKYLENNPKEAEKKGIDKQTIEDYTKDMNKRKWAKLKEKVKKKGK